MESQIFLRGSIKAERTDALSIYLYRVACLRCDLSCAAAGLNTRMPPEQQPYTAQNCIRATTRKILVVNSQGINSGASFFCRRNCASRQQSTTHTRWRRKGKKLCGESESSYRNSNEQFLESTTIATSSTYYGM